MSDLDDHQRRSDDRIITAIDQLGKQVTEQIRTVREELREAIRDNKGDAEKRIEKLEERQTATEKEVVAMTARLTLIAGVVGVAGAGLVEALVTMFGKK